jgi:YVTN family beta-propeller protein
MNATRKWAVALACALTIGAEQAAAGSYAYVPSLEGNTVSVIDAATHTVIATIPVGAGPTGVAATPDGRLVYVTNNRDATVSVIDVASNAVVATVPVGQVATGIATTPDGRFAYALAAGPGTASVIDTATAAVTATLTVGGENSGPFSIAFGPDGRFGYVANVFLNQVSVLDAASGAVVAAVPVGAAPFDVAVAPDGRFVYSANLMATADALSVIETAGHTVVASIALEQGSQGIAVHPEGRFAYVTQALSNTVAVVDLGTNAQVAAIPVGAFPYRAAVSPDGRFTYVTNQQSASVSVIDTASNTVVATVPVGLAPQSVAFAHVRPRDETAPSTAAGVAPAPNAAGWSRTPVTVTLSATDDQDGSGVKQVAYTLTGATQGGGQAAGASVSFSIANEGATTVAYGATDKAGNAEAGKTLALRIDTTAPASTASATPPAGSSGTHTAPVTVSVAATDGGSGVESIRIVRDSGTETFPGASASIIVSTPGVTTVSYQAVDVAGNVEPAKTLTVRIVPAAAFSAKVNVHPPVLWPVDRRFDEVHAHFQVANAVGRTKVKAVSVASDEPVGRTAPDWIVKGSSVKLRAERDDRGNGRVYTITYTLVDEAGNTAQASDTVAVPKYQGWHWNRHYSRWDRD